MPVIEVQQQSIDWLQMRIGMVTASRVGDVVGRNKPKKGQDIGEYSKARYNYLLEVVAERLTGLSATRFVTPWMEEGNEQEPYARAAYELTQEDEVLPGAFAIHPQNKWFGASVDARVGDKKGAEFKCLKAENHIEIIRDGVIPLDRQPQLLAEMACYELESIDFVSYCGRMPKPLQLFVRTMHRDDKLIAMMESEVWSFLEEVAAMLLKLGEKA